MEVQIEGFKWAYNSRTGLGQKTYSDGQWEIVKGKDALLIENNRDLKGDIHIGMHPETDEDAPVAASDA